MRLILLFRFLQALPCNYGHLSEKRFQLLLKCHKVMRHLGKSCTTCGLIVFRENELPKEGPTSEEDTAVI